MEGELVLQRIVTEIFTPLYQLAVACAFVYFLYGGVVFILSMNDPEKMNTGKRHLIYGTIGLFIIISVGGILELFNSVLGGMFTF